MQLDRATIRRRYLAVDSANVADALDELGLTDQGLHADFGRIRTGSEPLAGWAYPIQGRAATYSGGGDAAKMQACEGIGPDQVSVWAGAGEGICYFGELIALGMRERGSAGALVDAGIRDVRWLNQHNFSVFACYRTPVQSIGRWRVTGCNEPVQVPGATSSLVTIHPDDFILGDDDGVVVIPNAVTTQVLERAEALTQQEIQIRRELADGLTLSEALAKYGHV